MTLDGMVLLLVENVREPVLLLLVGLAVIAPMAAVVVARLLVGLLARRRRGLGSLLRRRAALDDLVELAAVEPDTPALRAIVDLDPLAVAHCQGNPADRA